MTDSHRLGCHMHGLLTELWSRWLDIGQAVPFFARLWTERESRSINTQKERGHYPAILTEQAGSAKELLYDRKIASSWHSVFQSPFFALRPN